jgi:hypothetical protein
VALPSGHGGALNRPSAGQAAALGGAALAAAAIAIGVAQIELSGQPQPHIWSNAWLVAALSLALAGLLTAAVFFVLDIFARKDTPSIGGQSLDDITRRCARLAVDIYTFEDERSLSRDGTPGYDKQTVYLYHLKFGQQELELASDVEALGVPREELQLLYDKQTIDAIHDTANFIKFIPHMVAQRIG